MQISLGERWRPRFFTIWTGQAFSMVGSALVRFAVIWWLTKETDSATVLTTASLVSTLPFILLAPFSGTFVDRWDRRWTMVVSDAMIALFTALLAYLYWVGIARIWHVYLILFLRSVGDTFQGPAMRAATSMMVPEDQLARVGGMNESLMGAVNIVSPPLGAFLLEILDMQGTLAIDIVTAVMAIVPLLLFAIPEPVSRGTLGKDKPVLRDFAEGFRYVWNWRGLFLMFVVLAGLRFFLAPSFSLLPLMVTRYFGGEALELGWMNSAHGFGFITGGLILSAWGGFRRRTVTALLGLIGIGAGMVVFGLVPASLFWLGLAVMFLRTMMVPMTRGSILAIFQTYVPPEMQGRVFTLLLSSMSVMAPFGLAIGGPITEVLGVRALFILAGLGCLGIAALWALNPEIMNLEARAEQRDVVALRQG
jgi:DHA3 family macrolide efflux protein-like MFS transporter